MQYIQTNYSCTTVEGQWQFTDIWVQDLIYDYYESFRGTDQFETIYIRGQNEGWISLTPPVGGV